MPEHVNNRLPPAAVRIGGVTDQLPSAAAIHPAGPVAGGFQSLIMAREERELSGLATRSYPARRLVPEGRAGSMPVSMGSPPS